MGSVGKDTSGRGISTTRKIWDGYGEAGRIDIEGRGD